MFQQSYNPLKSLINKYWQKPQSKQFWQKNVVLAAWNNLFPHTRNQLKKITIKDNIVYITLQSLILLKELRRKKQQIMDKLRQELIHLQQDPQMIRDIVFY